MFLLKKLLIIMKYSPKKYVDRLKYTLWLKSNYVHHSISIILKNNICESMLCINFNRQLTHSITYHYIVTRKNKSNYHYKTPWCDDSSALLIGRTLILMCPLPWPTWGNYCSECFDLCAFWDVLRQKMKWTTSCILCQVRPRTGVPALTKIQLWLYLYYFHQ